MDAVIIRSSCDDARVPVVDVFVAPFVRPGDLSRIGVALARQGLTYDVIAVSECNSADEIVTAIQGAMEDDE